MALSSPTVRDGMIPFWIANTSVSPSDMLTSTSVRPICMFILLQVVLDQQIMVPLNSKALLITS